MRYSYYKYNNGHIEISTIFLNGINLDWHISSKNQLDIHIDFISYGNVTIEPIDHIFANKDVIFLYKLNSAFDLIEHINKGF